jgi:hypothetical protein
MKTSKERLVEIEGEGLRVALSKYGDIAVVPIDDDQDRTETAGIWGVLRLNYDTDYEAALNDKLSPIGFHFSGRVLSVTLPLNRARWKVTCSSGLMSGTILRAAIVYQSLALSPRSIYIRWLSDDGFAFRFHTIHFDSSFMFTSKHRSDWDSNNDTFAFEVLSRPIL